MGDFQAGTVESIHIAARAEAPTNAVEAVTVVAGRGIEGDRYYREGGDGTFHEADKHGQDLTLIEADLVASTTTPTGSVQALVDIGFAAGITPDEQELELRPGAGVSFKVVGDLRLGAAAALRRAGGHAARHRRRGPRALRRLSS